VGHEEANVADGTADRYGKAGENGCGKIHHNAHTRNVHAEMHGFFFSGEEEIEIRSGGVNGPGGGQKTKR